MDGPPPQRWDRSKWITVFSSHSPTIREVTECLGLSPSKTASGTNRGIPKFDAPEFKMLAGEVTRLSKELPQDRDQLLDFAADPKSLENELNHVMDQWGAAIWGKDADRSRLLVADPEKRTYYMDLFYENPEHREMKLKKYATGEDYETIADIDGGSPTTAPKIGLSPSATPMNGTPPGEDPYPMEGPQLQNIRKRKSSVFNSTSDGERDASAPGSPARKRSYNSATMPNPSRSPPRKSLSIGRLSENIPPSPQLHHQHIASSTAPPPEIGRPLLSPLSNSALNGGSRPASAAASGFPAVNTANGTAQMNGSSGGLAPINAAEKSHHTSPKSFPAANPSTGTPNGHHHTFAATNPPIAPNGQLPPTSNPSAPHGALQTAHTQQSPPLAPAPGGFTAVNVNGPNNVPIAPQPRSYASPYGGGLPQPHVGPDGHAPVNGHPERASQHQPVREPSPEKRQTLNHIMEQPTSRGPPTSIAPGPRHTHTPPVDPSQASMQQTFHSHSIPGQQAASGFASKYAPHPPSNAGIPTPPILPSNAPNTGIPVRPLVNGHAVYDERIIQRAPSPGDTALLQCELLGLLMRYFYQRDAKLDDGSLLSNLEYIWRRNEPTFRRQIPHLYDLQTKVLLTWIDERRKISQLQYVMDGQPGVRAAEMVDRLLAMNDLRIMRLKWKALKTQDGGQPLSPEDLLCRTFAAMTKTEGTEHLFKDGLDRLNDSVFEFLRTEDMKISMSMGKR